MRLYARRDNCGVEYSPFVSPAGQQALRLFPSPCIFSSEKRLHKTLLGQQGYPVNEILQRQRGHHRGTDGRY